MTFFVSVCETVAFTCTSVGHKEGPCSHGLGCGELLRKRIWRHTCTKSTWISQIQLVRIKSLYFTLGTRAQKPKVNKLILMIKKFRNSDFFQCTLAFIPLPFRDTIPVLVQCILIPVLVQCTFSFILPPPPPPVHHPSFCTVYVLLSLSHSPSLTFSWLRTSCELPVFPLSLNPLWNATKSDCCKEHRIKNLAAKIRKSIFIVSVVPAIQLLLH